MAHLPGGKRVHSDDASYGIIRRVRGFSAIEPTLGFTRGGTLFYTAMQSNTDLNVVKSSTYGRTWSEVSPELPGGLHSHVLGLDPYLYVDPITSRVFTIDLTIACSYLSYSDDEAETWTTNPLGCGRPINDHQTLFSGPPVTSRTIGYPNLVYYCFNDLLTSSCTKSLDGGLTFRPTGTAAFNGSGTAGTPSCGGIHGHGVVGNDGTVYLPREFCGEPYLAISRDEGFTWDRIKVSNRSLNRAGADPSVAVDRRGNVYYTWIGKDRLPYLAVSRNGGRTWGPPKMIAAPGVTEANLVTIDVGRPGAVAVAYAGSTDSVFQECSSNPRCSPPPREPRWDAYIAQTTNGLSRRPLFLSSAANGEEPMFTGACGPGRCQALVDFIDVEIAPNGTPWGAFVDGRARGGKGEGFVATLVGATRLN